MTPELAAERASDMLDLAADSIIHGDIVENRIVLADAWMRLHTALANAPKQIEQPKPVTVHIDPAIAADMDPKTIAESVAIAMGLTPKTEPEIGVYSERAHLIAYLATQYPAKIAYNDPNEPDWPVIYLDTVYGQLSWHLAAGDLWLFPHIPVVGPGDEIPQWDGHTTAQKYERLRKLTTLKSDD